jgi:hypothetical protein
MGPVGQWLGESLTGRAQVSVGKEAAGVPLRERALGGPRAGSQFGPDWFPPAFSPFSDLFSLFIINLLKTSKSNFETIFEFVKLFPLFGKL